MDIFRDPIILQFWAVVVSLLGIIISIVIALSQRTRMGLVYYVLTETALLSIDDEIKQKISIKYGNKKVQNIHLVILKIENRGNIAIASSHYEQPLIFSFPESEIISNEVIEVSPKNLKPIVTIEASRLLINPILLNKKDYIVNKLIFSKYRKIINVDARIIGVKEIFRGYSGEFRKVATPLAFAVLLSITILYAIGFAGSLVYTIIDPITDNTVIGSIIIAGFVSLYNCVVLSYVYSLALRARK